MHESTPCSECGCDPCVCDRNPSDRPDATRIRKAKSRHKLRRGKQFEAWLEDYYRLLRGYSGASRIFRLLPIVTPANLRAAILACEEELQTLRDYWWVAMGIRDLPSPWDSRELLALGAMLADLIPLVDDEEEINQLDRRYPNNWRTTDSDIAVSAREQLSHELVPPEDDDTPTSPLDGAVTWYAGPTLMPVKPKVHNPGDFACGVRLPPELDQGWDPQAACELLRRDANRFSLRRTLRLKNGRTKEFEIARADGDVRRPPLAGFRAQKPPTGRQWLSRQGSSETRWKVKPARVRQIYRPPADKLGIEGHYRQDYPRWAAEVDTGQLIGGWTYPTYQEREHKGSMRPPLHRIPGPLKDHLNLAAVSDAYERGVTGRGAAGTRCRRSISDPREGARLTKRPRGGAPAARRVYPRK
jgi:hypothetical protein